MVETDEEELKERKKDKFKIEIPIVLENELEKLSEGNNRLFVTIKNLTGGDELKKVRDFNIKLEKDRQDRLGIYIHSKQAKRSIARNG